MNVVFVNRNYHYYFGTEFKKAGKTLRFRRIMQFSDSDKPSQDLLNIIRGMLCEEMVISIGMTGVNSCLGCHARVLIRAVDAGVGRSDNEQEKKSSTTLQDSNNSAQACE